MTEDQKNKITRYFNGTASPEEARWVLDWFETREGEAYLDAELSRDIDSMIGQQKHRAVKKKPGGKRIKRIPYTKPRSYAIYYAAAVFVAAVMLALFFTIQNRSSEAGAVTAKTEYTAGQGEQRVLTLGDGSSIRLNEGSNLKVPDSFSDGTRRVELTGEAYFEIESNKNRPFIISVGEAHIEVLGTSFLVKQQPSLNSTLVAVTEGVVSFGTGDPETGDSVRLQKNMVGFYNTDTGSLSSEQTNTRNYMSWFNGRIVFNGEPFSSVASELGHLYNRKVIIEDENINDLKLTTDISATSMEEVLETIEETLGLQYTAVQDTLKWSKK